MRRWSDLDSDSYRLPSGMERIGYDADTQEYTYRDSNGRIYEGAPGARYGVLMPRTQDRHPYPTARDYLEAHPKTYNADESSPKEGDCKDNATALTEKIMSPTKSLIRSLSKSTRDSNGSMSAKRSEILQKDDESSKSAESLPSTTDAKRSGSKHSMPKLRLPAGVRNLTRRLTLGGYPGQEYQSWEKGPSPGEDGPSGPENGAKNAAQPRAPKRAQTLREYIERGRDEKKDPPQMWPKRR